MTNLLHGRSFNRFIQVDVGNRAWYKEKVYPENKVPTLEHGNKIIGESIDLIGMKADWRGHQGRFIIFTGNKTTSSLSSVKVVVLSPSHLKLELSSVPQVIPPRAQVQCPLEVVNLSPSRYVAVLDVSYMFDTTMVENKLRIPAVINKFFQPILR